MGERTGTLADEPAIIAIPHPLLLTIAAHHHRDNTAADLLLRSLSACPSRPPRRAAACWKGQFAPTQQSRVSQSILKHDRATRIPVLLLLLLARPSSPAPAYPNDSALALHFLPTPLLWTVASPPSPSPSPPPHSAPRLDTPRLRTDCLASPAAAKEQELGIGRLIHVGHPESNWVEHSPSTVSNPLGWPGTTSQWHKRISK